MKEEVIQSAIKQGKALYKKIGEIQAEWDVFYKHNSFGNTFWKVDKKLNTLWREEIPKLPFATYPIRSMDDLLGYIEFHEIQTSPPSRGEILEKKENYQLNAHKDI